jgi:hypothetical protein
MYGRYADRRSRLAPQLNLRIRAATSDDRAFIETLGKRTAMDSVSSLRRVEPPASSGCSRSSIGANTWR